MLDIFVDNCDIKFTDSYSLEGICWQILADQHWVIIGPNGSGKSALAAMLAGEGSVERGKLTGLPANVQVVSFEAQRVLIEQQRVLAEDADAGQDPAGSSARRIVQQNNPDPELVRQLTDLFAVETLLERPFRSLSTGETRKILLLRAIASQPELLVLDEPYEGLDAAMRVVVETTLKSLAASTTMVFVLNRFDQIPAFVTHLAYAQAATIIHKVATDDVEKVVDIKQLLHIKSTNLTVPMMDETTPRPAINAQQPLVRMQNLRVAYGDQVVFENLDWTVEPHSHWQVTGANGSGKTCLLNLITGDHPQCYVNDIFVFGFQRGNRESIWQIKQYIGYVSTALQWEYRVSIGLLNVIISGFYDSIGLYQQATDRQKQIALQWLDLVGLKDRADQPFNQLSYGDQRLLLIARAMVKHPHLLILDEPCLGLDDINRQLVLTLIEKICADSQTTVIYVNHHAEDRITGISNYLAL